MSLHRRAAKRDKTEKAIVAALRAHGCVVWEMSGTGLTDLLVFYRKRAGHALDRERRTYVADCKSAKGEPTPAQVKRWTELTNLGFSVFILRTPDDAVAMLNDALPPWEPQTHDKVPGGLLKRRIGRGYTPPRSPPVTHRERCLVVQDKEPSSPCTCGAEDAAREAEAFAPPLDFGNARPEPLCSCTREQPCATCSAVEVFAPPDKPWGGLTCDRCGGPASVEYQTGRFQCFPCSVGS